MRPVLLVLGLLVAARAGSAQTLNIIAEPATATIYRFKVQDNSLVPIGTGRAELKLQKNDPNTIVVRQEGFRDATRSFPTGEKYRDKQYTLFLSKRVIQLSALPYDAEIRIGDRRKYPVLLVAPNYEQLEKRAKRRNIIWKDRSQLLAMSTINAKMDKEVRSQLVGLAPFEMPKKIALLAADFTLDSGELTPTLRMKRRVVEKNHKALIDSLYDANDPALAASRD